MHTFCLSYVVVVPVHFDFARGCESDSDYMMQTYAFSFVISRIGKDTAMLVIKWTLSKCTLKTAATSPLTTGKRALTYFEKKHMDTTHA